MSKSLETEKKKALELAVSHIQKQFGEGAIMALGKHSSNKGIEVIKTGAISFGMISSSSLSVPSFPFPSIPSFPSSSVGCGHPAPSCIGVFESISSIHPIFNRIFMAFL